MGFSGVSSALLNGAADLQDADLYGVGVQPGDLLIAATDGLWDNAYVDEVLAHLPQSGADLDRVRAYLAATLTLTSRPYPKT